MKTERKEERKNRRILRRKGAYYYYYGIYILSLMVIALCVIKLWKFKTLI